MAKELISRYMACKPTAASVGNGAIISLIMIILALICQYH